MIFLCHNRRSQLFHPVDRTADFLVSSSRSLYAAEVFIQTPIIFLPNIAEVDLFQFTMLFLHLNNFCTCTNSVKGKMP